MADSKNLSGRPKEAGSRRSKKIDVRFTEAEYQSIKNMEQELGLSQTDLVRMRVLNNSGAVVVNAKALLQEIDGLGAELGRVGNNINQLAHHANTLRLKGDVDQSVIVIFNRLMEEHLRLQAELEVCFRKIIRGIT